MAQYRVHVKISPWPEGGYIAEVPALQGCWVVADKVGQALADLGEVIDMSIVSRLQHGEPLPPEVVPVNGEKIVLELDLPVTAG